MLLPHLLSILILSGTTQIFRTCHATPLISSLQSRQEGSCDTTACQVGFCCSIYFYCGQTPEYCGPGTCDGGVGGTCPDDGDCCSPYGFCGSGEGYCGAPTSTSAAPTATPTAPAPPVNSGTVNQWNQCGGEGWQGGTVCVAPYICTYGGVWWSSCKCPGDAPAC